jgi:hypothetical protein
MSIPLGLENKIKFLMKLLPHDYDYQRMQSHGDMTETYEDFCKRNEILLRGVGEVHLDWLLQLSLLITTSELKLIDMEYCFEHKAAGMYHNTQGKLCIFNPR